MADKTLVGSYVSVADFTNDATGLNVSTLKPGILARMILRASRRVDQKCNQTLYATLNTAVLIEDAYPEGFCIGSDGFLTLFPKQFPIHVINSLSYRFSALSAPTAVDLGLLVYQPRWVKVDGYWSNYGGRGANLDLVYVAGWCVSTTSAGVSAGASLLPVNPLPQVVPGIPTPVEPQLYGWRAGQLLEIQDDVNTEVVTILYTTGNSVVLASPLAFNHAADTMVVDPAFACAQQATTLLASDLIKKRGVGPITLRDEAVRDERPMQHTMMDLEAQADDLLDDFMVRA